jgi:hypothetical protein
MTDEINRESLDYTLGNIEQRLASGDKVMERLSLSIDQLVKTIACLPCNTNDERLKKIENDNVRRYSFTDSVKLALITTAIGVGATITVFLITGVR